MTAAGTATSTDALAVVGAVFAALYAAHMVGDHWVQRPHDAQHKARPGWVGRWACLVHVATMTLTKLVALAGLCAVTGLRPDGRLIVAGLGVDALSHYWADRRTPLAALAALIPGKTGFWQLGAPRQGRDDNPTLGTGAYALDQSWHIAWLFITALIIAA
jgi:hypothetical protein